MLRVAEAAGLPEAALAGSGLPFKARAGVVRECYEGILSAPPKVRPRPFEIILETPKLPPSYLKEAALVRALASILTEYRKFIPYAQNL